MPEPTPRFLADIPIELVDARVLFPTRSIRQRRCACLVRLGTGRVLLAFYHGTGPLRRDDGAVMLSHSDDDGRTWDDPMPIYAHPGWSAIPMGGLVRFSDDLIRLPVGRITLDPALGGDEPMTGWFMAATDSRDGGRSWSDLGPEIRLYPHWTEMYGPSNPHPLADGRFLLTTQGTLGRDQGWRSGVTFVDPTAGGGSSGYSPPTILAAAPGRDFSDTDVVRLVDGRLLAVIREHATREAYQTHSADEGRTWSALRPTGFKGANPKLHRLRSGAIICLYRDQDPARPGISCSLSTDGGAAWRFIGQLYVAEPGVVPRPGEHCGYPTGVTLGDGDLLVAAHTYIDARGSADLHLFRFKDRS